MKAFIGDRDTTDLSNFNNDWYNPGGSKLKRALWYCVNVLFFLNPLNPLSGLKSALLRLFGARIGEGVVIKPNVNIKYPWNLTIGHHSWIGEKVWIDNLAPISIGNNSVLSQGAMLLTGSHDYTRPYFDLITRGITIEDGVWIGAKSIVCPGVTCFSHSILTVASIATKNLEAYCIYQGNPAEKKRERNFK